MSFVCNTETTHAVRHPLNRFLYTNCQVFIFLYISQFNAIGDILRKKILPKQRGTPKIGHTSVPRPRHPV